MQIDITSACSLDVKEIKADLRYYSYKPQPNFSLQEQEKSKSPHLT